MLPFFQQGLSGEWYQTYIRHPRNVARKSQAHEDDLEQGIVEDGIMLNKRSPVVFHE